MNRKVLIRFSVMAAGAGLILLSLFAFRLGLDNDPGWGPRRFQILATGIALILFGALDWIMLALSRWLGNSTLLRKIKKFIPNGGARFASPLLDSKLIGKLRQKNWVGWILRNQLSLWLVLIGCCALWSYVWIISAGRMEKWPSGRNYYWMLTQAFQKGQTHLLVSPNPELLKLENPYSLQQRKGLDYLWDTTLYNGKYYLYWGPVPAVGGVLVNLVTSKPVTDAGLVFAFVVGTALFSILLLRQLCRDYELPNWLLLGGALSSAVNIPLIWLFTHPAYYEVSISGGQFFMLLGFFLLYQAFRSSPLPKRYLLLSALAFGLAGGTRVNLLPSVIFLALLVVWRVAAYHNWKFSSAIPSLAAIVIPLTIIACSLAWYNYARFGSIFEFGHRYQLSGLSMTEDYRDQTSLRYVIPNLYTYVFRLPSVSGKFPFVTLPWIKENMWPSFIHLPENYYFPEPTAGILFVVPLIGFTALLLLRLFWLLANGDVSLAGFDGNTSGNAFFWLGLSLLGYVCIQMFLLLAFVSSSLRYLFDISPALILLSTMFTGYHIRSFEKKAYVVRTILFLWLLMSLLTIVSGFLIGLTGGQNNFLNNNPQLYHQLMEWFSR